MYIFYIFLYILIFYQYINYNPIITNKLFIYRLIEIEVIKGTLCQNDRGFICIQS